MKISPLKCYILNLFCCSIIVLVISFRVIDVEATLLDKLFISSVEAVISSEEAAISSAIAEALSTLFNIISLSLSTSITDEFTDFTFNNNYLLKKIITKQLSYDNYHVITILTIRFNYKFIYMRK